MKHYLPLPTRIKLEKGAIEKDMNLHSFLSGNTILVSKTFVEQVGRHEAFRLKRYICKIHRSEPRK